MTDPTCHIPGDLSPADDALIEVYQTCSAFVRAGGYQQDAKGIAKHERWLVRAIENYGRARGWNVTNPTE